MKYILCVCLFMMALHVAFCQVKQQKSGRVEMVVIAPPGKLEEVKIIQWGMVDREVTTIASGRFDPSGRCILKFQISHDRFAAIKLDKEEHALFLQPGYRLTVKASNHADTISFSGRGAHANNYLSAIWLSQMEIQKRQGKNMYDLKPEDALKRLDLIDAFQRSLLKKYSDSLRLPDNVIEMLKLRNKVKVFMIKQAFAFNHAARNRLQIPEILEVSGEFPYDTALLDSHIAEYSTIHHINMVLRSRFMRRDSIPDEMKPLIIRDEVQSSDHPRRMKEFLLAKNVDFWMSLIGVTSSTDIVYAEFKRGFPLSPYLPALEKKYNSLTSLKPGKLAPAIHGVTLQGQRISLNDFRDKVVYIDVWASWCGPCLREIPYSTSLQNKLKDNDQVIFLNVSVDADTAKWKSAVSENKNWPGVHILTDQSIYKTYNINTGIPRYILIDKDGKIVDTDARRPSSEDIEMEILKLLK